ncbi:MAG: serine/threonine-protein kinase [Sulfuricaulis sp.]|nr:serine/threonine-protein kinase [Sulfuricaulis sp.]
MGGFHKDALPHNFELAEYTIESMLGHGGFGITYLARDRNLDTRVAIKEYFPADLAVRQDIAAVIPKPIPKAMRDYHLGLKNFIKEARALAHFKHPNIVRVLRYLEAHDTAYMVMEYSQGEGLADQLRQQGPKLPEAALLRIFLPILNGVRAVHEADMLHLDIKPENIYLRKDGSPMLIDFGSTRQAISQTMPDKFLVTHGYAPIEQYPDKGKQGPWTDLYALGASMYRCISGKRPINALERYQAALHYQTDPLTPATVVGKNDYSLQLLGCIDWALQVHPRDRPQSARAFQDRLLGSTTSTLATASQTVTVRTATSTSVLPPATSDRRKKRHPAQRSNRGLVAALLLTIAGAGVYLWFERGAGLRPTPPSLPEPTTIPAAVPVVSAREEGATVPAAASATVAPTLRQSLRGHTGTVLSLAFSPDSKRIVSAAADGTIRLWDSASGKSLKILRRHQGAVNTVTYSADGRWLASAGHDGTIKLWEEKSGAIRTEWRGPGKAILAIAFSPDGRWLAAAGRDRVIQLWSVADGKLAHTYPGHHGDVLGLAFSPDGRTLASAGADRSVRLWNVGGTREPAGLSIYRTEVQALAFSPDGRWLASGTEDRTVRLVETGAGTQVRTFVTVLASVHALAYSPDGTQLVVGTADKKIQILDAAKGTPLHTVEGHKDQVLAVAMSPDGRWLASAGRDQVVQIWAR